ncbi:signal peptidase II [Nocardioides mangrovi]|uniref:Lipoprotein signal peptidase n=1 Tax=Nocardioides mangrovi TaxID=2874580 RepID=A0ABS7U773_9ACTN|nr:signal peptidase II [Nocardioides mangrovi]MBZ5736825.1 signal peptidase II [Nocardioides mangrovi]
MQAARGASLTGDAGDPDTTRPHPRRTRHLLVFALVAITAYAVDVVSKIVAVDRLTDRPDVQVVGDLLVLHLVRNPGAAFSTGTAYTEVFSIVAIVAVLVILYVSRRIGSLGWAFALGFLLAGVAGNLTDRLVREPGPLRGHVIDFFMLPHWPVFNVADMCIDAAAVLILVQVFRGIRLDGTRAPHEGDDSAEEPV